MAAIGNMDPELSGESDSEDDAETLALRAQLEAAKQRRSQAAASGPRAGQAGHAGAPASHAPEDPSRLLAADSATSSPAVAGPPGTASPGGLGLGTPVEMPLLRSSAAPARPAVAAMRSLDDTGDDKDTEKDAARKARHERLQAQREAALVRALTDATHGSPDMLKLFKQASAAFRHERLNAKQYYDAVERVLGEEATERVLPLAAAAVPVPARRLELVAVLREADKLRALRKLRRRREAQQADEAEPKAEAGAGAGAGEDGDAKEAKEEDEQAPPAPALEEGVGLPASASAAGSVAADDEDRPPSAEAATSQPVAAAADDDSAVAAGSVAAAATAAPPAAAAEAAASDGVAEVDAAAAAAAPAAAAPEPAPAPAPSAAPAPEPAPTAAAAAAVSPSAITTPLRGGLLTADVYGTQEGSDQGKAFTEYVLRCRWERAGASRSWLVARRYSEFDALALVLQPRLDASAATSNGSASVPRLPGKSLFGWSTGASVVEGRRKGLAQWLNEVLTRFPWVTDLDEVDRFLTITPRLADLFNKFAEEDAAAAVAAIGVGVGAPSAGRPAAPASTPDRAGGRLAVAPGRLASLGIRVPRDQAAGRRSGTSDAPFSPSVAAARAALRAGGAHRSSGGGHAGDDDDDDVDPGIFSPTGAAHGTPPRPDLPRGAAARHHPPPSSEGAGLESALAGLMSPTALPSRGAAGHPGGAAAATGGGGDHCEGAAGEDIASANPMLTVEGVSGAEQGVAALAARLGTLDLTRTDPRREPALQTLVLRARVAVEQLGRAREAVMAAADGRGGGEAEAAAAELLPRIMQAEEDATAALSDYSSVLTVVRAMGV